MNETTCVFIINSIKISMIKSKRKSPKKVINYFADKSFRGSETAVVPRPIIGFPDKLKIQLKYVDQIPFATATPTPGAQVYRANSLYDPDLTGAGHQPEFYDQLTAIYNQYCVVGCQAKVLCNNHSSTGGVFVTALYADVDNSSSSAQSLMEHRYAKTTALGLSGGLCTKSIVLPLMKSKQIQGAKLEVEDDPNNYVTTGGSPADPWYYIVKAVADDGATNVNMDTTMVLVFECVFRELKLPTQS